LIHTDAKEGCDAVGFDFLSDVLQRLQYENNKAGKAKPTSVVPISAAFLDLFPHPHPSHSAISAVLSITRHLKPSHQML
jgi:hypothetical protein